MKLNFLFKFYISFSLILFSCNAKKDIIEKKVVEKNKYDNNEKILDTKIEDKYIYTDKVFDKSIKTLLCHKYDEPLSIPILNLNSGDKLYFSFDVLNSEIENYNYSILHCNSNWEQSDLIENEFVDGFNKEPIINYEFSFNTLQDYIHYNFIFPSKNIKPLISGNYVFKVYAEDGSLAIYKRFMVIDKQIEIQAKIKKPSLPSYRYTKQEIDFSIFNHNFKIHDPFSDLVVVIKQNNSENNMIDDLTPIFVKENELVYNYDDENNFFGNNEFRNFDIKSLRYQSQKIKNIVSDSLSNNVYLFKDKKRTFDRYSIQSDINGNFLIHSQESWRNAIESDYAYIYFTLDIDQTTLGNLYVIGKLTDWQLTEENQLKYNKIKKQYEGKLFLKQGYYDYMYALKDTIENKIDISYIEGSHYETINDYYIYVYYKSKVNRYTKLIGFHKISEKKLF